MYWLVFILCLATATTSCSRPRHEPSMTASPASPAPTQPDADTPNTSRDTAASPPAATFAAKTSDRGTFEDLNDQVALGSASWVDKSAGLVIANQHADGFLFVGGVPIEFVGEAPADIVVDEFAGADLDADAIPDQFDVLVGAKKTAINNAAYGSPYQEIAFPMGDVPRDEGVCTDTLVRAVRNAGLDLQESLQKDIAKSGASFPMVKKPNANIDHRRVKTLLPHFRRSWEEHGTAIDDPSDPWLPGDVIFMQTMGDSRPDHVGIVTDRLGSTQAPLIINNFTDGYAVAAMDIARLAPITNRFRLRSQLRLPAPHGGLSGLLSRHEVSIPDDAQQIIVVTSPGWNTPGGTLQRYERASGQPARPVGKAIAVTLGQRGLAAGVGLHDLLPRAPAAKKEGDLRAPAGVFRLGTAFGTARTPGKSAWPYRRVEPDDRFVDDPQSTRYNTWRKVGDGEWSSAEDLNQYDLAIVVEHNMPAKAGAGSAIFLHTHGGEPATSTLGCTAMPRKELRRIIQWLDPAKSPVLVQLAGHIYPGAEGS